MLAKKSLGSVEILSVDYPALLGELGKITANIRKEHPDVKKILLFGSFARGDYTPESDVDILLTVDHSDTHFLKRSDEFTGFFRKIPFDVHPLVYTEDEIEKMGTRFEELTRDAVEL